MANKTLFNRLVIAAYRLPLSKKRQEVLPGITRYRTYYLSGFDFFFRTI